MNSFNSETGSYTVAALRSRWKKVWNVISFKIQFLVSITVLLLIAIFINDFFNYIQVRPGTNIKDVILDNVSSHNMSVWIFLFIYPVIILSVIQMAFDPPLLLKLVMAYCLLLILRIITLYLISLEPHTSIIPLEDPFIGYFFYGEKVITKDLFFSGHISTMFLLFLMNPVRRIKYFIGVLSLVTAILILIQHAHYTIDILAAPVFAWICFKLVKLIPKPYK